MPSYPEGWEYLGELPERWKEPADLHRGGVAPMVNLVIDIASTTFISNEIMEAAGRVLAEYAAYNTWSARQLTFEQQAWRGSETNYLTRDVHTAWRAFADKFGPVRRLGWADEERAALLATLRRAESGLQAMRDATWAAPPRERGSGSDGDVNKNS